MPSQSHGRTCLAVALCLVTLFLFLKIQRDGIGFTTFGFGQQFSYSGKEALEGISNHSLGFERIFAINAPWRTDRRDSISLAASFSGLSLNWIDGIDADQIREKAYPPGNHRQISHGNLGSWRAHMNAMLEIITQNLTTALILEDDADWDFRIRGQLSDFSHAARRMPNLAHQAEMHAQKEAHAAAEAYADPVDLAKRSSITLSSQNPRSVPNADPFGRNWDVLWLGHCGAELPPPSPAHPDRIMTVNDRTVPSPKHLKPTAFAPQDAFASLYPPHTRLYHRTSNSTLCTLAYAVTQAGARKILYQFGVRDFSKGYDFALSDYCNGFIKGAEKETRLMCLTVQPPLFSHFWSERGRSDIMAVGAGGRMEVGSRYVRQSVRGNLEALVTGAGMEAVVEQWPDDDNEEA